MRNLLLGTALFFIGIWGGTWLHTFVSEDYQPAAAMTAVVLVVGGMMLVIRESTEGMS